MTSSRSGSGSGSREAAVGDDGAPIYVGDKTRNSTGDTCGYYKPADGAPCRKPRSCYDCLNVPLASDCVLSPGGACQPLSAYVPTHDFRVDHNATLLSSAYYNYFPSTNTTYCEAGDPACKRCADIGLVDVGSSAASSQITLGDRNGSREIALRFCLGVKGCVCLAACATSKWENNVPDDCSLGGSNSTTINDNSTDTYRSMMPIFMALQFVLIIIVIHRQRLYSSRFGRRPPVRQGPYNNPRAIPSPRNRLQLTGWRAMQEEQVNREKAQRGLVSLMSPRDNTTIPPQPLAEPQPEQPRPAPHNYVIYAPEEEEDIPELPPGSPMTPIATRRRGSTDASVAMLEDGRSSDPGAKRPSLTGLTEVRESRSQ